MEAAEEVREKHLLATNLMIDFCFRERWARARPRIYRYF